MPAKLTIEEMQELAQSKGGRCLSDIYAGLRSDLQWECAQKHRWWAKPDAVKTYKRWCPFCAGKLTIEDMQALARSKGGKCLSDTYINNRTKLQWECAKKHRWWTMPCQVKNENSWCPACAKNARPGIEDMQALARSKGGRCLSDTYVNRSGKLLWECAQKHQWLAMPDTIKNNNSWCPVCAGNTKLTIGKMQELAQSRGGKCLSDTYVNLYTKLQWECDKKHRWWTTPATIKNHKSWCPECIGATSTPLTIDEMHALAQSRGGRCLSDSYVNISTKLLWECARGHRWRTSPATIKHSASWCPECANRPYPKLTIEEMQALAISKGGRCLSDKYVNRSTKLHWECALKHSWHTTASKVKNKGHWCPKCAGLNRRKHTIGDMQVLARSKGGKCLSAEYNGRKAPLQWECAEGHRWQAMPANIISVGSWCPKCAGKGKTIEDMLELAAEKGGKCMSTKYLGYDTPLRWQCPKGHIWEAIYESIVENVHFCQICRREDQAKARLRKLKLKQSRPFKNRGGQIDEWLEK